MNHDCSADLESTGPTGLQGDPEEETVERSLPGADWDRRPGGLGPWNSFLSFVRPKVLRVPVTYWNLTNEKI